ncbi:MAG: shikimate kinase [Oscillospiraceae bacterium]|nr:shikimate kinase [Oscillospiraceae bacterium]
MNIVITGFMASGKTEISKAIAQMSCYSLIDTDDMIVQKTNMTINEIFDKYGEEHFRKIEREIIEEAAESKNAVISTGGGVVLDKRNIDILRKTGVIINLAPEFSVIEERLEKARETRPLLKRDSIEDIKKRFEMRKPFYDNCDYKVNVINGRTPRSYAMEILKIMEDIQE